MLSSHTKSGLYLPQSCASGMGLFHLVKGINSFSGSCKNAAIRFSLSFDFFEGRGLHEAQTSPLLATTVRWHAEHNRSPPCIAQNCFSLPQGHPLFPCFMQCCFILLHSQSPLPPCLAQNLFKILQSQKLCGLQSLHAVLNLLCSHLEPPPHSMHPVLFMLCSQIPAPPQDLHLYFLLL